MDLTRSGCSKTTQQAGSVYESWKSLCGPATLLRPQKKTKNYPYLDPLEITHIVRLESVFVLFFFCVGLIFDSFVFARNLVSLPALQELVYSGFVPVRAFEHLPRLSSLRCRFTTADYHNGELGLPMSLKHLFIIEPLITPLISNASHLESLLFCGRVPTSTELDQLGPTPQMQRFGFLEPLPPGDVSGWGSFTTIHSSVSTWFPNLTRLDLLYSIHSAPVLDLHKLARIEFLEPINHRVLGFFFEKMRQGSGLRHLETLKIKSTYSAISHRSWNALNSQTNPPVPFPAGIDSEAIRSLFEPDVLFPKLRCITCDQEGRTISLDVNARMPMWLKFVMAYGPLGLRTFAAAVDASILPAFTFFAHETLEELTVEFGVTYDDMCLVSIAGLTRLRKLHVKRCSWSETAAMTILPKLLHLQDLYLGLENCILLCPQFFFGRLHVVILNMLIILGPMWSPHTIWTIQHLPAMQRFRLDQIENRTKLTEKELSLPKLY
jgi:hypothetical protein